MNEDEAQTTVQFPGRFLDQRLQEARPHVPYFIYLFEHSLAYTMTDAWKFIVGFVENMNVGFATCGFILDGKKWKIAPRTNGPQGK